MIETRLADIQTFESDIMIMLIADDDCQASYTAW